MYEGWIVIELLPGITYEVNTDTSDYFYLLIEGTGVLSYTYKVQSHDSQRKYPVLKTHTATGQLIDDYWMSKEEISAQQYQSTLHILSRGLLYCYVMSCVIGLLLILGIILCKWLRGRQVTV